MKKILLAFFLIALTCQTSAGGENGENTEFLSNFLSAKISTVFLKHGICRDKNDCRKKELFFFAPGWDVLHLSFYSMTDLKVVQDLIHCVLSTYEENDFSPPVKLYFHRKPHGEGIIYLLTKEKPFLTMSIKERKKNGKATDKN